MIWRVGGGWLNSREEGKIWKSTESSNREEIERILPTIQEEEEESIVCDQKEIGDLASQGDRRFRAISENKGGSIFQNIGGLMNECLGNAELGGDDVVMGDLVEAVSGDLLKIGRGSGEEGHVQIAKYNFGSGRNQEEEKKIRTALAFAEAVIAHQRHLKLKGNQEENLIMKSILKSQEANKIRELYRVICEFPEKPSEIELRKKHAIGTEWEFLAESKKVNISDHIDQLSAWRFMTQMKSKNLSRERIGEISENEMPGITEAIPIGETYNKYGDTARKVEIGAIGKHGGFSRSPYRGYRVGNP